MLLQRNPFKRVKKSLDEAQQWGTNAEGQSPPCWGKHREGNPAKRHLKEDLHGVLLKEKVVIKAFRHALVLTQGKGLRLFWEMSNHRRRQPTFWLSIIILLRETRVLFLQGTGTHCANITSTQTDTEVYICMCTCANISFRHCLRY